MTSTSDDEYRVGLVGEAETNRRLGGHLCVWCTRPLADNSPDATFHGPTCQELWMAARNGGTETEAPSPRVPAQVGRTGTDVVAEFETYRIPLNHTGTALILGPDLPPELDYTIDPAGEQLLRTGRHSARYATYGVRSLPRDESMLAGAPTRGPVEGVHLGAWAMAPGGPSLEEIPEPERPRESVEAPALRAVIEGGWTVLTGKADTNPPSLAPLQHCPRASCQTRTTPTLITARYPVALRDGATRAFLITDAPQTKVCCGDCLLPYPGPTVIHLWRHHQMRWEVAVMAGHRWYQQTVTEVAVERAPMTGLSGVIWGDLHHALSRALNPHPCPMPGCGDPASTWYLLRTALSVEGWQWTPEEQALRLGLCQHHTHTLRSGLYRDTSITMRLMHTRDDAAQGTDQHRHMTNRLIIA